jgi:hypothetical protein
VVLSLLSASSITPIQAPTKSTTTLPCCIAARIQPALAS